MNIISPERIEQLLQQEKQHYLRRNPRSAELNQQAATHWLRGVPMHWMIDWETPFPLFITQAQGVTLCDADGNHYTDFCLGDTGAMFGHSPEPIAKMLAEQGARGLTTMLPSPDAEPVGRLLHDRFGMTAWQVTATATDANRAIIRWCRAITQRPLILIFNHSYHGAVDETFIHLDRGQACADPALIGEPRDITEFVRVIEFNDLPALEAALADRQVARVLAEPVMTNVGMVLPQLGYLEKLREFTQQTGTLLVMDETHCLSSGPGGYCRDAGIAADAIVLGKPIAGGIPAAVYGLSAAMANRVEAFLSERPNGRSGIGTTLSGSAIQLAMMRVVLSTYFTETTFTPLITLATLLENGIQSLIDAHQVPWHVVRVGARVEFMCVPQRPQNGAEAHAAIHQPIDVLVHHYLLNRGVMITPFHNMMLICPATTLADIQLLLSTLDQCLTTLTAQE